MIGIIGAMEMEIAGLVSALEAPETAESEAKRS